MLGRIGWVIVILAALGGGGYWGYGELKKRAFPVTIPVRTVAVARADLVQQITLSGQIAPLRRILVTPPYNGYVRQVFVHVGETVATGSPLVSVAPSLATPNDEVFPIRAPYPGIVVQVLKVAGEYVMPGSGSNVILRVDDRSRIFVEAAVPELDLVKLRLGQDAVIKATAILDRTYKGVVREIALAARETLEGSHGGGSNAEFAVKLEVMNPDERLRGGMSVIMDVVAARRDNVLVLAHEFLEKAPDGAFVTLASGERRAVKLGLLNEEQAEIVEGLNEGEFVRQRDFGGPEMEK